MSMLDAGLLRRFFHSRDEEAFRELVRWHGPAVMAICRRQLNHHADAEDAYQLTFITLAKRAETIRAQESIRGWLCKVAYRVCINIQEKKAARRDHESHASTRPHHEPAEWERIERLLDHEVSQLPEDYRLAIWYCCLQGMTREETAEMLRLTPGQVKGRLERGRKMLRERLREQGINVPSIVLLGYFQFIERDWVATSLIPEVLIRQCMDALPPVTVAATMSSTVASKASATGFSVFRFGLGSEPPRVPLIRRVLAAYSGLSLGGKSLVASGLIGLAAVTAAQMTPETPESPVAAEPEDSEDEDDDSDSNGGPSVPEPGTAVLLGGGSLVLLKRRRR